MIKNNKKNYLKFIKKNDLTLFNIDPHSLRGKNFFKSIFQYREKIFKIQKKRIKKKNNFICNLCGGTKAKKFLDWKVKYELFQCQKCSSVSPNISHLDETEFVDSIYNNDLYDKKTYNEILKNYKYRKKNFGIERFNYTVKRLKLNSKSKVLDLGCGLGYFLSVLKDKKINYKGLEPAKNLSYYCRTYLKLNVFSTPLEEEKNNSYNLITLFDVLEHLKDPVKYFKIINKKLKNNSYCVCYTPNIHSMGYALMGSDQNTLLPFEHLCFFDKKSFEFLAKKTGFKVVSIETYGLDVTDYLLLKEFTDKFDYTSKLKEFISLTQSLIDKLNLSNHFRVTFKKIK